MGRQKLRYIYEDVKKGNKEVEYIYYNNPTQHTTHVP